MDTSNEGQNSSLLENESTPKDKNKRSKRWRKKSKKESSPLQKDFAESGKENSDLTEEQVDDKVKGKEKKSLKGRIKKMSLRKLSKQEKKNVSEITEESEKQETSIYEKDAKPEDVKMMIDEEKGKPGTSGVENESKDIIDKSEGIEKEEGARGAENKEKNEKEDRISEEEEDIAETSTEIRRKEDEERRKSRDNFDAVIVELGTKGPKDQNDSATPAEGDNAEIINDALEEKETATTTKEAENEHEPDVIVKIENEDGDNFIDEFELLSKEDDDEMITDDGPNTEENEKPLLEAATETKQREDEKEANTTDNENEAEENTKPETETEGAKEFAPIKGENLDLSQKIRRKAVGKVVGRYRQVHLTKTYCQCCSVM